MTERKPPGVSWETWIDRQIREGMERGDFDHLPGHGQPISATAEAQDKIIIVPRNNDIGGSHSWCHANCIQATLKFYNRVLTRPWAEEIRVLALPADQPVSTHPTIERVVAQSAPKYVGSVTGTTLVDSSVAPGSTFQLV